MKAAIACSKHYQRAMDYSIFWKSVSEFHPENVTYSGKAENMLQ